jgi:hypothetical protein
MPEINGSVGRGGINRNGDVQIVQMLLNKKKLSGQLALVIDGLIGPKTIASIEDFQRRVLKFRSPDGLISPSGPTIKALLNQNQVTPNPPVPPLPPVIKHNPVLMDPVYALKLIDPKSKVYLGGIWGTAKAGQTFLASDGQRLILSAIPTDILYLLIPTGAVQGGIYRQSVKGFFIEINTYSVIEGARRALPMARLAEIEMQIIMGITAATSWVGFIAVVGSDMSKFLLENKDNFSKWYRIVEVAWEVRSTLKRVAPTLYEKLFDTVLTGLVKEILPNTPENINAEAAARMVGILLGKLGKRALESRLTILSIVWTILLEVTKKCLAQVPKTMKATVGEYKESADKVIRNLQSIGAQISPAEMQRIYDEISRNPREIKDALERVVSVSR